MQIIKCLKNYYPSFGSVQSPRSELLSLISKFIKTLDILFGLNKALKTYFPVHNSFNSNFVNFLPTGFIILGGGTSIISLPSEKQAQS